MCGGGAASNAGAEHRRSEGPLHRAKPALCSYLGREKEGRDIVQRLLRANPAMTIAGFEAFVVAHQVSETSAVFVEGFRRAGLPEK
jgi:hypothetical protein